MLGRGSLGLSLSEHKTGDARESGGKKKNVSHEASSPYSVATYGRTIFAGSTILSNSASVT
jgi:hypothetical protein